MKKTILWVVAAVLVVWGAWTLWGNQGASGDTYKIGFIAPLSGDAAVYGEPGRNIVQLAVEEINAAGGVNGKRLEMVYEDGKCNGKDSASAAQKLVNVDKVQIIIGGFCSSESLASIPVAESAKVVLFSPGSSSPDLTGKSPYFFRDYPSDASQGKVLAEVAYNQKNWRKVAFIQEQLDYPLGIYKAFSSTFQGLGGTVTKEEFPSATTDFRSILAKIKSQKPDAIFVDTQTPAGSDRILKQMSELGLKFPILISDATAGDAKTVADNAKILEGALAAEFGVDSSSAKFQHLNDAYKQKYGVDAPYQSYAQTEYDSVYIVRDGIAAVGYNGEKFAAWSRTIKDWPGASGLITIGPDGDRVGGHTAKVIHNGKVEILK